MKCVQIVVGGKVQGVGFRLSAAEIARNLDLVGFVRNEADGTVQVNVEGNPEHVEKFISEIRKGPNRFVKVRNVDVLYLDKQQGFERFEVR
ncbi:acylphosphatase [Terribacillus sp. 179-K 1B1 HS]|uniref:Acylphosphatase n=1 Tax=Terribacillus halophilus TaxID=361279 RepID=A0A1G6VE70_9BACI|nr:acylphosphatase [Terribacillus halophilus]SDD51116.1 acylphosphatase [Terribacillus halophilus]